MQGRAERKCQSRIDGFVVAETKRGFFFYFSIFQQKTDFCFHRERSWDWVIIKNTQSWFKSQNKRQWLFDRLHFTRLRFLPLDVNCGARFNIKGLIGLIVFTHIGVIFYWKWEWDSNSWLNYNCIKYTCYATHKLWIQKLWKWIILF